MASNNPSNIGRIRHFQRLILALLSFFICADAHAQSPTYLYFPDARVNKQNRLLSLNNQWFQFGGDLKLGFMKAQKDDTFAFSSGAESAYHDPQSIPRFYLEEILLTPQFSLADRMKGHFQLQIMPEDVDVRQGYAVVYLPYHAFVQFGLDRRFFMGPPHETVIPSLLENSVGDDTDLQLVIGSDYKIFGEENHLYWKTSLSNGRRLAEGEDTAFVGKQKTYPILSDAKQIENFDRSKELGFGLGFGKDFAPNKWFEIQGFAFLSQLHTTHAFLGSEVDFLKRLIPGYTSSRKNRHRIGGDGRFQFGPLLLGLQYIHSRDGDVKRHTAAFTPIFTIPFPFSDLLPLNKIDLIYRWNLLNVKAQGARDNVPESPLTWDRMTHSFAFRVHSNHFFSWQSEFHVNLEETGGDPKGVKNNEFLSQITFYF